MVELTDEEINRGFINHGYQLTQNAIHLIKEIPSAMLLLLIFEWLERKEFIITDKKIKEILEFIMNQNEKRKLLGE